MSLVIRSLRIIHNFYFKIYIDDVSFKINLAANGQSSMSSVVTTICDVDGDVDGDGHIDGDGDGDGNVDI